MLSASEAARNTRLPSLPALDGLRAIAVAAVLLYHADVSWMPGGFLGVEVFFVLSGYLITALLWAEWRAAGSIVLRGFWVRRARRLLPALFTMLILLAAAVVVFWPAEAARVRAEAAAAGGYVSNWFLIFQNQSYFQEMGRPSPLRHLWSLAIEMQFYLLWPLALAGIARRLKRTRRIAGATIGLAALSAALMWVLIEPGADPSRGYYGTDTRAAGLLIGAALALAWRPFERRSGFAGVPPRTLGALTIVGLAAIGGAFLFMTEFSASTYRPGLLLVSIASAGLIAVAVHPANALARRTLGWRWMRAAGRRSYSIYLWHWPVFVLTRPDLDLPWSAGPVLAGRIAITLVLAELSYRYVEIPLRTGLLGRTARAVVARARRASESRRRQIATSWAGAAAVPVLLLSLLAIGLVRATPPGQALAASGDTGRRQTKVLRSTEREPHRDIDMLTALSSAIASPHARITRRALPPLPPLNRTRALAVGDSVMAGARYALKGLIPRLRVDAETSRHVHEGVALLGRYARAGKLPDEVIVHLGNNGVFIADQFVQMMRTLRDVDRVVVVGVHVPRRWQDQVNNTLRTLAPRYDNVMLVDWDRVSRTCPGQVFGSDGLHLTGRGAACYARAVAGALVAA